MLCLKIVFLSNLINAANLAFSKLKIICLQNACFIQQRKISHSHWCLSLLLWKSNSPKANPIAANFIISSMSLLLTWNIAAILIFCLMWHVHSLWELTW